MNNVFKKKLKSNIKLLPFLDEYFEGQGCANYEENRFEILSLAEMEICSR